jgi:hypothetical protein
MNFPTWPNQDYIIKELALLIKGGKAREDSGLINISTNSIDLTVGLIDDLTWPSVTAQFDVPPKKFHGQKEWSPTSTRTYRLFIYKYRKIEDLKNGRYSMGQINGMCDASNNVHLSLQYMSMKANPDEKLFHLAMEKTLDFLISMNCLRGPK